MSIPEIHNSIGNRFWLEQISENGSNQNISWVFHQPANDIKGMYLLYNDDRTRIQKSGEYDLKRENGKVSIIIDGNSDFYLDSENLPDTMIWHSKTKNIKIVFKDVPLHKL